jgi:6-phosphogluconolactonase (cycloisomerase 2 family)
MAISASVLRAQSKSAGKSGQFAYVGCFTTAQRNARGDGIHGYRVNAESGAFSPIQRVDNLVNPSFLILSADQRFLYSSHGDENYASAFAVDKGTGQITRLGQADTGGTNGAHLALHGSGRFLVVANYASGSVAVLPVLQDGRLGDKIQVSELHAPPGPHRTEQNSPHPHEIVFDPSGHFVLVPDKGADRVWVFRFDAAAGKISPTEQGFVKTRAGSGPRHLAFHPRIPVVWVLNEINSSATTYGWDAERGSLQPLQIVPTLPPDFTGNSTAAEIAVSADGRYVYCSNRGHDSVVIYSSNPQTGLLTAIDWVPAQGKSPRFISFDPERRFLYAAGEQSDKITVFRADSGTGRLSGTGISVENASPVTIAFTT